MTKRIKKSVWRRDEIKKLLLLSQATEVNKHPPQMGNVTATATVTIMIRDVNNNPPTFSNTSYTATIRENSPPGVPLTLNGSAQITVSDKDRVRIENTRA